MSSANVYFVEFEQVNIYLRKFDVWSLKLFDSFIFIHYDFARGLVTSFIRWLFKKVLFSVFKLKRKTTNKLQIWVLMFSYFKSQKTTYFDVFCPNVSIETKIKTVLQISYLNLSKKAKWHFRFTDLAHLILTP